AAEDGDGPAQAGAVVLEGGALARARELVAGADLGPHRLEPGLVVAAAGGERRPLLGAGGRRRGGDARDRPVSGVELAVALVGPLQEAVADAVDDGPDLVVGGVVDGDVGTVPVVADDVGVGLRQLHAGVAEGDGGGDRVRVAEGAGARHARLVHRGERRTGRRVLTGGDVGRPVEGAGGR